MKRCADSLYDESYNTYFFAHSDTTPLILSHLLNAYEGSIKASLTALRALVYVSKGFHDEAQKVKYEWMQTEFIPLKHYGVKPSEVVNLVKKYNFTRVNLSGYTHFINTQIKELIENCPGVTQIDLSNTNLRDIDLLAIGRGYPNLTHVNFSDTSVTDRGMKIFGALYKKIELIAVIYLKLTDASLLELAKKNNSIREIYASHTLMGDSSLSLFAKNNLNLKILELSFTGISDISIFELTKYQKGLEVVTLQEVPATTESILKLLQSNLSVTELNLSDTQVDGNKIIEQIILTHTNILSLYLSRTGVTWESLKKLATHCSKLKHIAFSDFVITNPQLLEIKGLLPDLTGCYFNTINLTDPECENFSQAFLGCLCNGEWLL